MATSTTNYNLSKPSYSDAADIAVINSNMDLIDAALKGLDTRMGTAESNITSLQNSVSRKASIESGIIDGGKTVTLSVYQGFFAILNPRYATLFAMRSSDYCTAMCSLASDWESSFSVTRATSNSLVVQNKLPSTGLRYVLVL